MEHINIWNKGMNKDLDPLILNKDSYENALNLRLITEKGGSTPSLINIKGNSKRTSMPDLTGVHRVSLFSTGATNITIQGQIGAGITIASGDTIEDVYNYIISDTAYTNCVQNTGFTTVTSNSYNIYFDQTYLYVVGAFTGTTTPVQNTITISVANFILALQADYVSAQTDLYIIGSTFIRDDIFIFTTSNSTKNPGGHDSTLTADPTSAGQIWKLEYNQVNDTSTLSLLYNNYIDFTARHPIPPTAVTGRYENSNIKRIYWTDNFNKLRSFNTTDPQGFATLPSLLDIKPAIDFSRPELQEIINGGILESGVYECAYRLKNNNGALSKVSPLSNPVNILSSSEQTATGGGNFSTYIGDPINTTTSKAIT